MNVAPCTPGFAPSALSQGSCMLSPFSRVQLSATPWTAAQQAPCPRDFPGKNTGVGCHALLPEFFPAQGSNLPLSCLLPWQWTSLPLHHLVSESKSLSRVQLCNTVHEILQVRILEWVAFPFSRGSSQPRNRTGVSCIAGGFFTN